MCMDRVEDALQYGFILWEKLNSSFKATGVFLEGNFGGEYRLYRACACFKGEEAIYSMQAQCLAYYCHSPLNQNTITPPPTLISLFPMAKLPINPITKSTYLFIQLLVHKLQVVFIWFYMHAKNIPTVRFSLCP